MAELKQLSAPHVRVHDARRGRTSVTRRPWNSESVVGAFKLDFPRLPASVRLPAGNGHRKLLDGRGSDARAPRSPMAVPAAPGIRGAFRKDGRVSAPRAGWTLRSRTGEVGRTGRKAAVRPEFQTVTSLPGPGDRTRPGFPPSIEAAAPWTGTFIRAGDPRPRMEPSKPIATNSPSGGPDSPRHRQPMGCPVPGTASHPPPSKPARTTVKDSEMAIGVSDGRGELRFRRGFPVPAGVGHDHRHGGNPAPVPPEPDGRGSSNT